MKTYSETAQPGVILDTEQNYSFPLKSAAHQRMLAEVASGKAQLLQYSPPSYADKRLDAYRLAGLTADGWTEGIVEMLGMVAPMTPKFAALWAKREEIRAAFPKPNGT